MINTLREWICVFLGISIGLLMGIFIFPIMYDKHLRKEGYLRDTPKPSSTTGEQE
jgi:hypothetical protein